MLTASMITATITTLITIGPTGRLPLLIAFTRSAISYCVPTQEVILSIIHVAVVSLFVPLIFDDSIESKFDGHVYTYTNRSYPCILMTDITA